MWEKGAIIDLSSPDLERGRYIWEERYSNKSREQRCSKGCLVGVVATALFAFSVALRFMTEKTDLS